MSDEKCCNAHKEHAFRLKANEDAIKEVRGWIWKFMVLAIADMAAIILFFVKVQFFSR